MHGSPPTAPPRAQGYRQPLPHRAWRGTAPGTVGLWVLHRGRFTGRTWCSRPPGSWWALLTARTGALYEQCNHMGAQALAFDSEKRCVAASLFLRSPGSREHGLPGPARGGSTPLACPEDRSQSSPRPDYPPGTGSCISSIFRKAGGWAGREAQRKRIRIPHEGG